MSSIIVLGMHRSGTSLVTSIIQQLGIHIGDRLLGTHPSQPKGHFEDIDFYELNMDILKVAGGNWMNPPSEQRILAQRTFKERIAFLLLRKSRHKKFCWKDPRTCLTIPLYLPHLKNPRFVLVYRDVDKICSSLVRRSGGNVQKWEKLTARYQESMERHTQDRVKINIQFESLINRQLARKEVERLNKFIGGNGNIKGALNLIDFRL